MGEYARLNNLLKKEQQRYQALKEKENKTDEDLEKMIDIYQGIGEIEGALLEMAETDGLDDPYEAFDISLFDSDCEPEGSCVLDNLEEQE